MASGLLALVWSQQRRLIYFPSPGPVPSAASVVADGARDVVLETEDGIRLGAWYSLPGGRQPCWYSTATRETAGCELRPRRGAEPDGVLGVVVRLPRLRRQSGRPTEDGLAADARAAQAWLAAQPGVERRIAYFGESLGAAVAVGLAVQRPPAALVLRSPFTSLADVGAVHYPWLPVRRLLLDRYPSIERIASVHAPVLVIAGDRDDIVPEPLSKRLYDAAAEPKRYVLVPGVGHNDPELLDGQQMLGEIEGFLSSTGVT